MKYISRLTAMLLALMMLLSSAALADTAADYDEWLAAAQAANGAYCSEEYCAELYTALHMTDVDAQYEYLKSLEAEVVTDEDGTTYTKLYMVLAHYGLAWNAGLAGTDTAHGFDGTELCTCYFDQTDANGDPVYTLYPYGDANHAETCGWHPGAIDGAALLAQMLSLTTVAERESFWNELYPAEIAAVLSVYRTTATVTEWEAALQAEDAAAAVTDTMLTHSLLSGGTDRIWLEAYNLYSVFDGFLLATLDENGQLIDTRYHIPVAQVDENGNIVPLN